MIQMSRTQQQSFIAAIKCDDASLTLFEHWLDRSWFTNTLANRHKRLTSKHRYSSLGKMVAVRKARPQTRSQSAEMFVYFQNHGEHYTLQILSEIGQGLYIGQDDEGALTAVPSAATAFNLVNANNQVVTLDHLAGDQPSLYLQVRGAATVKRQLRDNPAVYSYADKHGDAVKFDLAILQRNVAAPNTREPYVVWIEPRRSDEDDD